MDACEKKNLRYIHPTEKGQRSNFYKFTLLAKTDNPIKEFEKITQRTSPVYDYALGEDLQKIAQKHICLPIWYKLEDEKIENVIEEIDNL